MKKTLSTGNIKAFTFDKILNLQENKKVSIRLAVQNGLYLNRLLTVLSPSIQRYMS